MAEAVQSSPGGGKPFVALAKPFGPEDETALREALKRCSPSTFEAAVQYRKTGNPEHVPAVVIGIIERFVEPDLRTKLKDADDDLRLIEDLGIDSLTMMEIVILVEDVLQLTINNDDLRNLRAVGDVKIFIDCKIRGLPMPKPTKFLPIEEIGAVMPIQPPFLFLNEASVSSIGANGKYKISGQEFFLQGHFKDNPVMPASIMLEALGQLAVLYLLEGVQTEPGKVVGGEHDLLHGLRRRPRAPDLPPGRHPDPVDQAQADEDALGHVRRGDPRGAGESGDRRGNHHDLWFCGGGDCAGGRRRRECGESRGAAGAPAPAARRAQRLGGRRACRVDRRAGCVLIGPAESLPAGRAA